MEASNQFPEIKLNTISKMEGLEAIEAVRNGSKKEEQKMKSLKLFVSVAIVCLLVGASGAAMADEDCASGYLTGYIEGNIIIPEGGTCYIEAAIVVGHVKASFAKDVTVRAKVRGSIVIRDSELANVGNSTATRIVLKRNKVAFVGNSTAQKSIRVNENILAVVKVNYAGKDFICKNNQQLKASRNQAEFTEDCKDEI